MKKIDEKELVKIVAGKLDLDFDADNFGDFKNFVNEVYSQFTQRWESLDDQAYYWHNFNISERIIRIPTSVLRVVLDEANEKLGFMDGEEVFFDMESEEMDGFATLDKVVGENVEINYVDNEGVSVAQTLEFWQSVSARFGCEIEVVVGSIGRDEGYADLDLRWTVTANGINANDAYFTIEDDGAERLMDALYWLTECFINDTFTEFDKIGVELRYVEK